MVMSASLSRTANLLHCWIRRLLGVAVALAVVGTSAVLTAIPARADFAVSPSFTIRGAGWGHGWGMSQYGASAPGLRDAVMVDHAGTVIGGSHDVIIP